jgi:putative nucleotidyltransferase with HDIG domain
MDFAEFQILMSRVVNHFTAAIENTGIYPDDHPQVISFIRETHNLLTEMFELKREITIMLIGDSLMVDKQPLIILDAGKAAFIKILRDHSIERMTFTKGLPLTELAEFIKGLSAESLSAVRSSSHIRWGKLELKDYNDLDTGSIDYSADDIDSIYDMQTLTTEQRINNIYGNTLNGEKINLTDTDEIVRHFMDSIHREANPLRLLAETKSNDEYTFTHTANVGILTLFFAEHLGFQGSDLKNIGVAALLHDVGKVTTPEEILSKTGPLNSDERSIMETHTTKGAFKLMEQADIPNIAVLGAMEHHMKYDGTGYPRIRGGWKQNIVSQLISITDIYDALRTIRPYRPIPVPVEKVIHVFTKGSGSDFNPYLVERFLKLMDM